MIKHLAPRAEEEIELLVKEEVIDVARRKLKHAGSEIFNYPRVSVYINSFEIANFGHAIRYMQINNQCIFSVTFVKRGVNYEVDKYEKIDSLYLHRNWYASSDLSKGDPRVRPYDL